MRKADHAVRIHNAIQRHAPKFEEIDLLLVHQSHFMFWVGNADEGKVIIIPIFPERFQVIRTDGDDLDIS